MVFSYIFFFVVEDDNELKSCLVIILGCFSSIAKNYDEPPRLSLFLNVCFFNWRRWWQAEIPICWCPWLFFFNCRRQQQAFRLIVVFCIFFFSQRKWRQVGRFVMLSWFYSSITNNNDESRSRLVIVLGCFSLVVEDDNEPLGLLLFSWVFFQL